MVEFEQGKFEGEGGDGDGAWGGAEFGEMQELDGKFLKRAKVSWLTRTLLGLSLTWGVSRLARELSMPGIETSKKAHALFQATERVDIIPSKSAMRGFRIVLDGLLSLYFSQDGDHFVYDGFEMAWYDLLGKYLEVPVWHLLGGKRVDRVPVDYWMGRCTPEDTATRTERARALGVASARAASAVPRK